MELESIGSTRHGRLGRARLWAAVLLPIAILVTVSGAAVMGSATAPAAPSAPSAPSAVAMAASPTIRPAASAPPSPTPDPRPVQVPDEVLGLAVLDVPTARSAGEVALDPTQLLAIEGWLAMAPGDPRCESVPPLPCGRNGLLGTSARLDQSALRVESLPGVPLIGLTRQSPSIGTWTVPNRVVVIGRFVEGERAACTGPPRCGPTLRIERLAWLRTADRPPPVVMGPGAVFATWTAGAATDTALRALSVPAEPLLTSVSDRGSLAVIDPEAAAAVAHVPRRTPVWYVRAVVWRGSDSGRSTPVVGWSVVDDRTHEVIDSGHWLDQASGPS